MERKKRSHIQKKKQIFFLAAVVLVLIFGLLFWLGTLKPRDKKDSSAAAGGTSDAMDSSTVRYGGKTYRYNDHLSNYLFLGIDSRESVDTYETQMDAGQADAIYIISLDRAKNTLWGLSIPRDTMAQIEAFNPSGKSLGMTEDHINLQYAFGDGKTKSCELMKTAVSNLLYQVPIQGYCSLNMDAIPVLTGLVGGVPVTVPDDSLAGINPEFTKGAAVTITEDNAEQFVRYRDIEISQSALVRMNRQKVFLAAYLAKVQELGKTSSSLVGTLYDGVKDYMVTNMGNDVFVKLLDASYQSDGLSAGMETLPGEGTEGADFDEYHVDEDQLYDLIINMFYEEIEE